MCKVIFVVVKRLFSLYESIFVGAVIPTAENVDFDYFHHLKPIWFQMVKVLIPEAKILLLYLQNLYKRRSIKFATIKIYMEEQTRKLQKNQTIMVQL